MSNKKKKEFMNLYRPVHATFERFCKARVYGRMDFKDLMQETIIVAFEKFETLQHTTAFKSFLIGISIKLLANDARKMKELRWNHDVTIDEKFSTKEESSLEIEDLYKALNKLPELQKEAIILFEINGFSIKEIADIQNSGESAVKQRLARGRMSLRELLTDEPKLVNY